MQHQSSGGQWLGEVQVTVPAVIMDWLRNAAYAEIGLAAEALDTVAFAVDREGHPEWFRGPAENLREIYALLDAIGWSKTVPPVAVQLDPVGEREAYVVERERAARTSRDLHALDRREVRVDRLAQLAELLLERRDLGIDADLALRRHLAELLDLPLHLDQRLLELQCRSAHVSSRARGAPVPARAALAAPAGRRTPGTV